MDYNQLANMPFNTGALMLNAAQQADMQRNIALIARYNQDPYSLSKAEREQAKYYAQQYGLDTSEGDFAKPPISKQALALGGGLLDALLFGILKDSWYSNEDTKTAKNIGKAAGLLASFLLPWSFLNATKGTKAAVSMAKSAARGAEGAAKSLSAGKSFQQLFGGGVKVAGAGEKALKGAKAIGAGAKSALATNAAFQEFYANMSASQALAEIAKALVRGGQIAGVTQEFLNPLMNQQEEIDMMYPMTAYGMPMLPQ